MIMLYSSISFIQTLLKHLWMSVSSISFYEKVFDQYKGYGIKYIFTLAFIASFLSSLLFLSNIQEIRDYLRNKSISKNTVYIDHVINQLPEIDYDGRSISIDQNTPLIIKGINNQTLVAIDHNSQLKKIERSKIPIIMNDKSVNINILDKKGEILKTFTIKYVEILGNQPQILTNDRIRFYLFDMFNKVPRAFIYIFFPIIFILIIINALRENLITIMTLYIFTRFFFSINTSLMKCIRVSLFASGVSVLFQLLITITFPQLLTPLWLIQSWSNILMILGLLKYFGNFRFKSMF